MKSTMKFAVVIIVVLALANAEADVFNGYDYPKPAKKLCPDGSVRDICEAPKHCPPGYSGEYPNCFLPQPKCAPGAHLMRSQYGAQCVADESPVYIAPVQTQCPAGTHGIFPDCRVLVVQRYCPIGTIGVYPNCKASIVQQCPLGTIGVYPNCQVPSCPPGTVGTYPNCFAAPKPKPQAQEGGYNYPKPMIPFTF